MTFATYFAFVDSHVIGLLRTWFLMKFCMASSILPLPKFCSAHEILESIVVSSIPSISQLLVLKIARHLAQAQITDLMYDPRETISSNFCRSSQYYFHNICNVYSKKFKCSFSCRNKLENAFFALVITLIVSRIFIDI